MVCPLNGTLLCNANKPKDPVSSRAIGVSSKLACSLAWLGPGLFQLDKGVLVRLSREDLCDDLEGPSLYVNATHRYPVLNLGSGRLTASR